MGLAIWLKFPVLVAKYPCNGSLGELEHRNYSAFGGS